MSIIFYNSNLRRPDTKVQTLDGTFDAERGRLLLKIRALDPALFSNLQFPLKAISSFFLCLLNWLLVKLRAQSLTWNPICSIALLVICVMFDRRCLSSPVCIHVCTVSLEIIKLTLKSTLGLCVTNHYLKWLLNWPSWSKLLAYFPSIS